MTSVQETVRVYSVGHISHRSDSFYVDKNHCAHIVALMLACSCGQYVGRCKMIIIPIARCELINLDRLVDLRTLANGPSCYVMCFCGGQLWHQCGPSEVRCVATDDNALIENDKLLDVQQRMYTLGVHPISGYTMPVPDRSTSPHPLPFPIH